VQGGGKTRTSEPNKLGNGIAAFIEKRVRNLDVVFDTLGGSCLDKSFSITRPNGWVVPIGGSPDYRTAKDVGLDIWRSSLLGIVGFRVNARAKRARVNYRFMFMKPLGDELAQIAALVTKGAIKPVVDRIFPIAQPHSAIEYSESGRARGKIVLSLVD
jgi:NADPH:quinone reductase-like Zn-dependent oxidoreductase